MFWSRFYSLCIEKNSKPNPVAKELGISSAVLTKWKNSSSYPNGEVLIKISQYFGCSIDYLVGLSDYRFSHEYEISKDDQILLEKFHLLQDDNKEELILFIDLKLRIQEKRNVDLFHSPIQNPDKNLA